jgi:hypothetical protein
LADLSDVEGALLGALIGLAYPAGLTAPSILGSPIRLYRGWPITAALTADIAAGTANVSVFAVPGGTRNTTRWGVQTAITPTPPALTVSVVPPSASFAGTAAAGQLAGILADQVAYIYQVQAEDSPSLVAAALYTLIVPNRPCLVSGATLTVPGAIQFVARTTQAASGVQEWARQEQGFRVSVWCASPSQRDTLCGAIGSAMAQVAYLPLADGTGGRIRARATASFDDDRDTSMYRRDLLYDIEYGTTATITQPTMLFGDLVWNGSPILA